MRAEPNVTPLIDVLLVVIIIFMLTVPLAQGGLDVSLPSGEPASSPPDSDIVLEYSADRRITLNAEDVPPSELGIRLRAIYSGRRDKTMWLSGAGTLRYGEIVDVIDTAKSAGVERVGVITPDMRSR